MDTTMEIQVFCIKCGEALLCEVRGPEVCGQAVSKASWCSLYIHPCKACATSTNEA